MLEELLRRLQGYKRPPTLARGQRPVLSDTPWAAQQEWNEIGPRSTPAFTNSIQQRMSLLPSPKGPQISPDQMQKLIQLYIKRGLPLNELFTLMGQQEASEAAWSKGMNDYGADNMLREYQQKYGGM